MKKSTNKNNPFAGLEGEKFGGESNYLQLEEGEQRGPFSHIRIDKNVELEPGNKPVDLHVGLDPESSLELRMPAAAVFRKNIDKANLKPGDQYHVARLKDAIKKGGTKATGKGKPMEVYSLLVTKRAKKK